MLEDCEDCDLREDDFFFPDFLPDFFVEGALVVVVVDVDIKVLEEAGTVALGIGLVKSTTSGFGVACSLPVSLDAGSISTESKQFKMELVELNCGLN